MLNSIRIRRSLGLAIAILGLAIAIMGVAALAIADDPPPLGACVNEDAGWKTMNGGCQDQISGLVWGSLGMLRVTPRRSLDWKEARADCDALVEGGYSDWRLPTLAEYQNAAAHGAAIPTPHVAAYYDQTMDPPYYYGGTWSATYKANKAYEFHFANSTYGLIPNGSGIGWYCVRP